MGVDAPTDHHVSLAAAPSYDPDVMERALRDVLAPLGGMTAHVRPGESVLLKLNLLSKASPERAVTTHPEFLRAVIRSVREAGGDPRVGDSPGGPNTQGQWRRICEETGVGRVCAEEGIPLLLFDERPQRVHNPGGVLYQAFTLGAEVVEADAIITLPKFKTHGFMMFTGAVKNLFGCIPGLEKAQYHLKVPDRDDFASMLLDLLMACAPRLAIMDAVVGMEGEGPAGGQPRHIGALLASPDSIALDTVAATMAGLSERQVYTIRMAQKRGMGPTSLHDIRLSGPPWQDFAPDSFKLPARDLSVYLTPALGRRMRSWTTARPYLEKAAACTGCKTCKTVCPVDAIEMSEGGPAFDRSACIRCYCCQELCPPQAIGLATPPLARLLGGRKPSK